MGSPAARAVAKDVDPRRLHRGPGQVRWRHSAARPGFAPIAGQLFTASTARKETQTPCSSRPEKSSAPTPGAIFRNASVALPCSRIAV